jgi:MFS transporter, FSR family, fosmidomycin resistance protein
MAEVVVIDREPPTAAPARRGTDVPILAAISVSHLLNDMVQSLIPAMYPILKVVYHLDLGQVGLITFCNQLTASVLQPVVGFYTDRRPLPYSLPIGMGFTLLGIVLLSIAPQFTMLLVAVALVGVGSAIFHPESSRVARLASGGQHGLAQSVFQVGGNAGASLGPLLAAFIVVPYGQRSVAWFVLAVLLAIAVLSRVGRWYKVHHLRIMTARTRPGVGRPLLSRRRVVVAIGLLIALVFSKYIYLVSLTNYYTLFLIGRFHVSVRSAELHLFAFLAAVAAGTIIGGPVGDRLGRKYVIWGSILGVLPFTLILPYANLFWTGVLSVLIGLVLSSAFSAILVYAQELVPGRIGMISGLFFGLAFGVAGLGAAWLGALADRTSLNFVYHMCSFLPLIGLLAAGLPNLEHDRTRGGGGTAAATT